MAEASRTDLTVTQTEESFTSQGVRCAATIYRPCGVTGPTPVAVMAHGITLTRRDGIPAFARRFAATGCCVVARPCYTRSPSTTERLQARSTRPSPEPPGPRHSATPWTTSGPSAPNTTTPSPPTPATSSASTSRHEQHPRATHPLGRDAFPGIRNTATCRLPDGQRVISQSAREVSA